MSRRHGVLVRFLLLSLALSAVRTSGQTTEAAADEDAACVGTEGNSDLYGLGIRVGAYLQALALMLATAFKQPSYGGIMFATIFFQLSVLVGVVYITAADGMLEATEVAITNNFLLYWSVITFPALICGDAPLKLLIDDALPTPISFGLPKLLIDSDPLKPKLLIDGSLLKLLIGYDPPNRRWSQAWAAPLLKWVVDLSISVYTAWQLFAGIDVLPCTDVKTPAHASLLRVFSGVLLVLQFSGHLFLFLFMAVATFPSLRVIIAKRIESTPLSHTAASPSHVPIADDSKATATHAATEPVAREEHEAAQELQPRHRSWRTPKNFRTTMAATAIICICIWFISIELAIKRYDLSGMHTINTVGQLIPFLTGVGSFLSFLLDWETPGGRSSERTVLLFHRVYVFARARRPHDELSRACSPVPVYLPTRET